MQLTNVLVSLAAAAGCATAAVVKIAVGERGGLTYTPDTVKADIGDVLEFHFVGGTHDAVLGDFDNPCKPATPAGTGFASGVIQGSTTNVCTSFTLRICQNTS